MNVTIRQMSIDDYDSVAALWMNTEGVGLDNDSDSYDRTRSYLDRNPGMSFVAESDGEIIGAVLCGHDGRRGYLHHLAVIPAYRRKKVASALVDACISALSAAGIPKCNIMVFDSNDSGQSFWKGTGWARRSDLLLMQKWTGDNHSKR